MGVKAWCDWLFIYHAMQWCHTIILVLNFYMGEHSSAQPASSVILLHYDRLSDHAVTDWTEWWSYLTPRPDEQCNSVGSSLTASIHEWWLNWMLVLPGPPSWWVITNSAFLSEVNKVNTLHRNQSEDIGNGKDKDNYNDKILCISIEMFFLYTHLYRSL